MKVPRGDEPLWVQEARNAIYGLGGGPLAWQLCLLEFLVEETFASQSHFGENSLSRFDNITRECPSGVSALSTCHVDDNNVAGKRPWLDRTHISFLQQFGRTSRKKLHAVIALVNANVAAQAMG